MGFGPKALGRTFPRLAIQPPPQHAPDSGQPGIGTRRWLDPVPER